MSTPGTEEPTADEAIALNRLAQAVGLDLDAQQTRQLLAYLDMLQRWNGVYNLTAVRSREGMWTQHLADCLAVVQPVARHFEARSLKSARILDVGSGGGLPGLVLAVCLPALAVTCVDTVSKKVAFVRQVAAELSLANLRSVHGRVESLARSTTPFDLITARAFASLPEFVGLTQSLVAPGACWLAMKGKTPYDEITQLPQEIEMFHVEQLTVPGLDAQRCLVWMRPRSVA